MRCQHSSRWMLIILSLLAMVFANHYMALADYGDVRVQSPQSELPLNRDVEVQPELKRPQYPRTV